MLYARSSNPLLEFFRLTEQRHCGHVRGQHRRAEIFFLGHYIFIDEVRGGDMTNTKTVGDGLGL